MRKGEQEKEIEKRQMKNIEFKLPVLLNENKFKLGSKTLEYPCDEYSFCKSFSSFWFSR